MCADGELGFPTPGREIKTVFFESCLHKVLLKDHSSLPFRKGAGEIILICSIKQLTDNLKGSRGGGKIYKGDQALIWLERQCHSIFFSFLKYEFTEHLLYAMG